MGPTQRDSQSGAHGLRRRRIRKQKRKETRLPLLIRRGCVVVTLVSALAYVGMVSWTKHMLDTSYGRLSLGMDESELRYIQGPPTRIEGNRVWVFDDGKRVIRARLDQHNRVEHIQCVASSMDVQASCPLIASVGSGSSEVEVKQAFGAPSNESFIGQSKLLDYRGVGLTFRLDQGNVIAIDHGPPQSGLDWWRIWLWLAMP